MQGALTARLTVQRFKQSDIADALHEGAIRVVERDELLRAGIDVFSTSEAEHNLEVYNGLNNMLRLLIGAAVSTGGTNYANGTARLCVGDGSGSVPTAAVTDTDLAAATGASHRYCNACDSTYPSVPNGGGNSASAILTAVATVASGNGNFEWREWGMDSGGSSGTSNCSGLFNHRGVDLGLKTSAAAWALTAAITQS